MSLPQVEETFLPPDDQYWSQEARRLRDFLRLVDHHLTQHAEIKIYGSAAVTFYTAAEHDPIHMTEDIDVGYPRRLAQQLQQAAHQARAEGPELDFHVRPPGLWLAAGDWPDHCVDVSTKLHLTVLSVGLMHPYDLIISKLIRWNERDADDAMQLGTLLALDPQVFGSRLEHAVQDSMVTDWQKAQLAEILEEFFDDEAQLDTARRAAPALDVE